MPKQMECSTNDLVLWPYLPRDVPRDKLMKCATIGLLLVIMFGPFLIAMSMPRAPNIWHPPRPESSLAPAPEVYIASRLDEKDIRRSAGVPFFDARVTAHIWCDDTKCGIVVP